MLFFIKNMKSNEEVVDPSMARIVMREQLEKDANVSKYANVQFGPSCVEVSGSTAKAFTAGKVEVRNKLIDGIYVNETTQFQYNANVTANCSPDNLNCYSVNSVNIDAVKSQTPSL
jgi:hypothetical protein